MHWLESIAAEAARTHCPVLLIGDPGTGKRALAIRMHHVSHCKEPFEEVDCANANVAAMISNDVAAVLQGGTVYLHNFDELSLPARNVLLAVYSDTRRDNLPRLIAATRQRAYTLGASRHLTGFGHALASVSLLLPPLRRRSEDILVLAEYFRNSYSDLFGRDRARLSNGLSAFFLTYAWPGNIDELDLAIRTLVATADEGVVMEALQASALCKSEGTSDRPIVPLKKAARAATQNAERELICNVLERTDWNRKRAARELQISYKALLYKIKQIGLDEQDRSGLNAGYNEE